MTQDREQQLPTKTRSRTSWARNKMAGAALALTVGAAAVAGFGAPSVDASANSDEFRYNFNPNSLPVLQDGNCIPALYIPRSGEMQAGVSVTFERHYWLNGQEITSSLAEGGKDYTAIDANGKSFPVDGLHSANYDNLWTLQEDPRQRAVTRASFVGNETSTQAYEAAKQGDKIVKVGDVVVYSAVPKDGNLIEVVDRCGDHQLRRSLTATVQRIIQGGILKDVKDNEKRLAENCILRDTLRIDTELVELVRTMQPAPSTPIPTPKPPKTPAIQGPIQGPIYDAQPTDGPDLSTQYGTAAIIDNPNQLGRVLP